MEGGGSNLVKVVGETPQWKSSLHLLTQAKGVTGAHIDTTLLADSLDLPGQGQDTPCCLLGPCRKEFSLGSAKLRHCPWPGAWWYLPLLYFFMLIPFAKEVQAGAHCFRQHSSLRKLWMINTMSIRYWEGTSPLSYKWGNWGPGESNHLSTITQPGSNRFMFPIQVPTPGQDSSSDCGYSEIKTLKVIGLVAKGRAKSGSLLQN